MHLINWNQRKFDKMNQPVNHSTVFRMDLLAKVSPLNIYGYQITKTFYRLFCITKITKSKFNWLKPPSTIIQHRS